MSVCVCCTDLFSFFALAFVLVNDLSLVSRCFCFGNAYDFVFWIISVWLLMAFIFETKLYGCHILTLKSCLCN